MGWETSDRRQRLPAAWPKIRGKILKRDGHRCTHTEYGIRCDRRASEVDHIEAGDDHRDANLRSLCTEHHASKSGREGGTASAQKRAEIGKRYRRTERHPGLL